MQHVFIKTKPELNRKAESHLNMKSGQEKKKR